MLVFIYCWFVLRLPSYSGIHQPAWKDYLKDLNQNSVACKQCTYDLILVEWKGQKDPSIHIFLLQKNKLNTENGKVQKEKREVGARMKRWPSYPFLSLISVAWGTEARRITGPQHLRNAASHYEYEVLCFLPSKGLSPEQLWKLIITYVMSQLKDVN